MALGRNKCVIGDMTPKKVMPHEEFVSRIRKSLYYGRRTSYKGMAVSRPLAIYASELFSEPHKGYSLNRLTEEVAGGINASPCALIMALIYLDRLNANDPGYVRRITPSELFIVSLVISTKFYWEIDEQHYLRTCARESTITEERIKELELQFLFAIDWNIYISDEEFFDKLTTVEKTLARREGIKRGWLTYTELLNLLPSFAIAKFLLSNIAVMAVSYAASVITIAGAFFLVSHITGSSSSTSSTLSSQRIPDTHLKTIDVFDTSTTTATTVPDDPSLRLKSEDPTIIENSRCNPVDIDNQMQQLESQYNLIPSISENNQNIGALNNYSWTSSSSISNNNLLGISHGDIDSLSNCYTFMEKDDCDEVKNATKSIFWNLIREGENVFIQFPFIWFKFI